MKIGYFIEKFPYEDQYSCQEIYPCSGAEVAAEDLHTQYQSSVGQ